MGRVLVKDHDVQGFASLANEPISIWFEHWTDLESGFYPSIDHISSRFSFSSLIVHHSFLLICCKDRCIDVSKNNREVLNTMRISCAKEEG
jgi:hypothetical protein